MRRRLRVKLPKNGCVKEGNACPCRPRCLDTSARTEPERWNHEKNDVCRPLFWGPKFGPQNGGHITIFYYDGPHFGVQTSDPKMGSRRSGVFGAGALSKDGFRQQVTQWARLRRTCPCLCPFCLVVRLILADSFAFSRTGEAPLSATGFCADFLTSFWGPLE